MRNLIVAKPWSETTIRSVLSAIPRASIGVAQAHQVVVAQAERFHRGQPCPTRDVLREIGIMLPEDDQRGPACVGSALGFRQSVLDREPREVQIALLVGHRGFRFGRHFDLVAR